MKHYFKHYFVNQIYIEEGGFLTRNREYRTENRIIFIDKMI